MGTLFSVDVLRQNATFTDQLDAIVRATSREKRKLILGVLRELSKGLKELK